MAIQFREKKKRNTLATCQGHVYLPYSIAVAMALSISPIEFWTRYVKRKKTLRNKGSRESTKRKKNCLQRPRKTKWYRTWDENRLANCLAPIAHLAEELYLLNREVEIGCVKRHWRVSHPDRARKVFTLSRSANHEHKLEYYERRSSYKLLMLASWVFFFSVRYFQVK